MAIMQVPVVKGKGVVEIDTDAIPQDVFAEALLLGLKTLVNRGMTKVTEKELGSADAVKAEAMAIAQKNLEKVMKGDIKFSGKAKATKVSGAVNTEAMRLARIAVKDAIKAAGMKISNVKASEITAAAKELVNTNPSFIEQATANLAEREKAPVAIDIKSLVHEDAGLVAKNEAKAAAAKKDKPLSAKQAGQVKGRKSKPAQANA
jgi:hypothetical protein